ncbi:hypothetical protein [Geofilum rhodophaeum]|uniref:hypothetical protein n=1 Tax=Geofilum rhodophaeum TaxID=1965019 RepID=UPI0013140807|nr:hypothetical protein [Geofilum rhodophaeum]
MEKIGEIIKKQQASTSLQKSSSIPLRKTESGFELSVYRGELSQKELVRNAAKVKAAFPALPPEFFQILIERFKAKGFCDTRMIDAVNNVIDNCPYPTPTLANFLSYDKNVKLYTYQQFISLVTEHKASFETYTKVKHKEVFLYVSKADKFRHGIPDEI